MFTRPPGDTNASLSENSLAAPCRGEAEAVKTAQVARDQLSAHRLHPQSPLESLLPGR